MTIACTHPTADYIADLLIILRASESGNDYQDLPYYDGAKGNSKGVDYQNVTIGDGINIDWNNKLHLTRKVPESICSSEMR